MTNREEYLYFVKLAETTIELSDDELVDVWNSYCRYTNDLDSYIYPLEYFNEILKDRTPLEILRYAKNINPDHINNDHSVFTMDVYGYYYSFKSIREFFTSNYDVFEEMITTMLDEKVLFGAECNSSDTMLKMYNIITEYNELKKNDMNNKNIIFKVE